MRRRRERTDAKAAAIAAWAGTVVAAYAKREPAAGAEPKRKPDESATEISLLTHAQQVRGILTQTHQVSDVQSLTRQVQCQ